MQDDSIVIRLFRNGLEKGPVYRVTVYDSGKVIYEGLKNVKINGKIETSVDEEKIVLILENLKDSGIFSINQKYSIDESSDRSFTRLSVDMPGGNGQVKTKSVVHYDDEPMIPHSLKNFEDKIDELVESYKWVKVPKIKKVIEPTPVKSSPGFEKPAKNISPKKKQKSKKTGKFVIIGVILVLCLIFFMFFNINDGKL